MPFDVSSFLSENTPLISAMFGGAGVKVLERLLSNRSNTFVEAEKIREEIRTDLVTIREEAEQRKAEADEWRIKYWEQFEENRKLKAHIIKLTHNGIIEIPNSISPLSTGSSL